MFRRSPCHLTAEDLERPGLVFQIGVAPVRIGIVTSIDGVEFCEAWDERASSRYGDEPVSLLSRRHVMQNQKAVGSLPDLADIEALEKNDC